MKKMGGVHAVLKDTTLLLYSSPWKTTTHHWTSIFIEKMLAEHGLTIDATEKELVRQMLPEKN